MSTEAGFLYVLINASMPDVVKVGKTERDPESRAKELSGVTGVPTPFAVVYQEFFDDCSVAEEYVHALLEESGYRVATNREFFSAPTRVAIQAVIRAKAALGGKCDGDKSPAAVRGEPTTILQSVPWEEILAQAEAVHYGFGDALQDLDEAARLYQQAARLGSAKACLRLAEVYLNKDFSSANDDVAITWLKEGGRRGNAGCYGRLARVYLQHGHTENASKCWKRFCEGSEGCLNDDFCIQCFWYVYLAAKMKIDVENIDWLKPHGVQIVATQWRISRGSTDVPSPAEIERRYLVAYLLETDVNTMRSNGTIKWWDSEKGHGVVTGENGESLYLFSEQIVEGGLPPVRGQQCDFVPAKGKEGDLATACVVRLLRGLRSGLRSGLRWREALKDLSKEEASEVATTIGLSSEQLLEAKTYPLSDKYWPSMTMMPAHFFPRAWKQMEEEGNAAQMMNIAAVLARVMDGQLPPDERRGT